MTNQDPRTTLIARLVEDFVKQVPASHRATRELLETKLQRFTLAELELLAEQIETEKTIKARKQSKP